MYVKSDDAAYVPQFIIRGFKSFPLPAAPAVVYAFAIAVAIILVPALTFAFMPVTQAQSPGAGGIIFAFIFAVFGGVAVVVFPAATIAKLHTSATPFPGYYWRLAKSELTAPRPSTAPTRLTIEQPGPLFDTSRVTVAPRPHETRSPHVCCPHPRNPPRAHVEVPQLHRPRQSRPRPV